MVKSFYQILGLLLVLTSVCFAQQLGSIRGTVQDKDFDSPLGLAKIQIVETGKTVNANKEGGYVINEVNPGKYTLVFSKQGYVRQVKTDVVVSPGRMTDVNAALVGEFEEMDEFVAQDLKVAGSEEALLELRMESPALMDSIGSDLISQAGASDAASALKLVSGASVQDGKFAVIRGLPDRYVSSQMNGVRLPTADQDKRAVELDQFPSAVIESIQVTKTFTPDQQGDASGGAVNIVLKGVPERNMLKFKIKPSYNTQSSCNNDFLKTKTGKMNYWGRDKSRSLPAEGVNSPGNVGVETGKSMFDYDWSMSGGLKHEFDSGIKIGGYGNFYYKRDSFFDDKAKNDSYWVEEPGQGMVPKKTQIQGADDFKTSLYDMTQGKQIVKWSGLGAVGIESKNHSLTLMYLYTRVATDTATLLEDTRGKAYYRNLGDNAAPYLRLETSEYTERTTQTLQLTGRHKLTFIPDIGEEGKFQFLSPELDWTLAHSIATMDQPDKQQLGTQWMPIQPGNPRWGIPDTPATHYPYKPAANFTVGNYQRIWKSISEDSDQYFINLKLPFTQWTGDKGYFKFGIFHDEVTRKYDQESYSNLGGLNTSTDIPKSFAGDWNSYWSEVFANEGHVVGPCDIDVDYRGEQEITAVYYMADVPVCSWLNIIGGVRHENTSLSIKNKAESDVVWYPPGSLGAVELHEGDADVTYEQQDVLPSLGFVFRPIKQITFRGTYSETVARQTFKELTPIMQQEYLGGPVFIGNPDLQMSALQNYDLRLDYTPYEGSLLSVSWFYKHIKNPIEYVQKVSDFAYTTPVNYPKGKLQGIELELRQDLGRFWSKLDGLTVGANATFISSEVTLPEDESEAFNDPNIMAPMKTRDMTNAPEYLYNLYFTYDIRRTGTRIGMFYTVEGDSLIAGAGQSNGNYIPNLYQKSYGTLNLSVAQKLSEHWTLTFEAKNLLNPKIQTVYRSKYIGSDVTETSYRKGTEFNLALSASW